MSRNELNINTVPNSGNYDVTNEDDIISEDNNVDILHDIIPSEVIINNMNNMNNKKTIPYLTKYEMTSLLGKRAVQLANGAIPTVSVENIHNEIEIARKELEERKIPLIIRRNLPDGTYEDWTIDQLIW